MQQKSVILPIVAVNGVMFLLQIIISGFTEYFMLVPSQVLARPYILLTSVFLHAGFNHIFWNMYALIIFGPLLEQRIGPKRFLFIYLLSGLLAAIGHIILSLFIYGSAPPALGASGAVMGMLGVLIVLMPYIRLLFFFFIPMSLRTAGIIWIIMDMIGVFVPSGVGNLAHLVGVACGLIYGFILSKGKKKYYRTFMHKGHITIEDVDDYMKHGKI